MLGYEKPSRYITIYISRNQDRQQHTFDFTQKARRRHLGVKFGFGQFIEKEKEKHY
jgi:hypothetical protein